MTMNLATVGPFVVSVRAVAQGPLWEGVYSVRRFDEMFKQPAYMLGEVRTSQAYLTKEEAAQAALSDAQAFVGRHMQRGLYLVPSVTH
jgi:hypothetical protein